MGIVRILYAGANSFGDPDLKCNYFINDRKSIIKQNAVKSNKTLRATAEYPATNPNFLKRNHKTKTLFLLNEMQIRHQTLRNLAFAL